MGMCCREAEGKALLGQHEWRAWVTSSCGLGLLAWLCPHLILCRVLGVACLLVLLLLLLLARLHSSFVCKLLPSLQGIMHAVMYFAYAGYLMCLATRYCEHGVSSEQGGQCKHRASAMRSSQHSGSQRASSSGR